MAAAIVSLSVAAPAPRDGEPSNGFAHLLKTWRRKRRLSQLDLALSCGVSQRHLSFLETGRANPSRAMILQLSEALDVPLRDRNQWLNAAGFAPIFQSRPLDDPAMTQVMSAVRLLLANHEPFPAVAIDRNWNIQLANRPFETLSALLGNDLWKRTCGPDPISRNLMRLFFHPDGIQPYVANWTAIAPLLWYRAQREAEAWGGDPMQQVLEELRPFQCPETLRMPEDAPLLPVLPLQLHKDGRSISLFTVIATFGTPQDVTADELRMEMLFPGDEPTERLFRGA